MEFKLNKYNRNIPDEEFLQDMKRVADQLNQSNLTTEDYNKYGLFHNSTIGKRFGGWKNACIKAGLQLAKLQQNHRLTDEEIISDIKRVANSLEMPTITTSDYKKSGSYDQSVIFRRFKNWNEALRLAGLNKSSNRNTCDEELLIEIERIWTKLGKQPTSDDIKKGISIYSLNTFARRFGGWRGALETFIEYINAEDEEDVPTISNEMEVYTPIQSDDIASDNDYNRKTKREPNLRLRFFVLSRDNFKCCACGASPAKDPAVNLHIDHIIPWSKGGETVIENLQTLCQNCNLGKSDL